MKKIETALPGVYIVELDVFRDDRGFFVETYNRDRYRAEGIMIDEMQDNFSVSLSKGVLRGLHFQREPFAQGKLVRVARGRVFDVAVDIRQGSATFGKWVSEELSGENQRQLWIPAGFAHGFVTLEDDTIFEYKCTKPYSKEHDGGIAWNDPDIGIRWPVPVEELILSDKDKQLPLLKEII